MSKGKLFVVSGPSGAGKSTITKKILNEVENLYLTISVTTRKPRKGEVDGREYYFYSKEEFEEKIEKDYFLEYALVHDNYYGTLKSEVTQKLEAGQNVLLEIDVQGGGQVKKIFAEAILIFIKAPSIEELQKRLNGRATDSEEVIQKRLKNSIKELSYEEKYNYIIINDEFEKACEQLKKIINK
ncbi:MAG: guanylate kinase [Fusobacteriia bacterium 4572_132]|nr:MAG: guanylate kinase [Fusobacteriia bacterium 4572_132]